MTDSAYNPWSPENRQKAANAVYDSITMLDQLAAGWAPDPYETPEEQAKDRKQVYDNNLQFLTNALTNEYYEGYLDKKRVEDAIAAAESSELSSAS